MSVRRQVFIRVALIVAASIALLISAGAQTMKASRPKLVVGITVDQMRWDYLYRFASRYGDGGFKRFMNDGYCSNNMMINYIPTVTAVGHTSIYTGSIPAITGITGNDFYFENKDKRTYCTDDANVGTVGSKSVAGKMSPRNLLVTTVTDELRLATNFRSKVIGISIKDRGAILPAGHTANAAYWLDSETDNFITSTYYMKSLPKWVNDFNKQKLAAKMLKEKWTLKYDEQTYVQSTNKEEASRYENPMKADIRYTPFGNTLVERFAESAIDGELLGQHDDTDFVTVSFSSTDYIGHSVGPNSALIEDTYLRLDEELARMLSFLDDKIGKGNYLVFLTADHAASHNPTFLVDHNIPAGGWNKDTMKKNLNDAAFGKDAALLIKGVENFQVHFNYKRIDSLKLNLSDVKQKIITALMNMDEVSYAFDINNIPEYIPQHIRAMVINGYNPKRSGEIQIIPAVGYSEVYAEKNGTLRGTNHGVWSPYDAHIPFLMMGWNIEAGVQDNTIHHITDIAPTVAALLHIQMPSGCVGEPINTLLKSK